MKICLNFLDSNSDGISIFNNPSASILADISPPQKTKAWSGSKCLYNSLVISLQEEKSHKGFVIKKSMLQHRIHNYVMLQWQIQHTANLPHISVQQHNDTHTQRHTH